MAKFLVPPSYAPCILSNGHCRYPGDIDDYDSKSVRLKLVPVDAEAYALLVSVFGAEKVQKQHGLGPAELPKPKEDIDDTFTMRDLAKNAGSPLSRLEEDAPKKRSPIQLADEDETPTKPKTPVKKSKK